MGCPLFNLSITSWVLDDDLINFLGVYICKKKTDNDYGRSNSTGTLVLRFGPFIL